LADHLSTERPCDHQKSWNVCLVQKDNFVSYLSNTPTTVAALGKLKSTLKVMEFEQGMSAAGSEMSEEQILHSASSIIRREIESLDITEHEC
jgi:hypothetical protein